MINVIDSFTGENAFLSNFAKCDIFYKHCMYPSTEHAYQAAKCKDYSEKSLFFTNTKNPLTAGQAKRLGRKVSIRDDWEENKVSIMIDVVGIKFNNPYFAQKLLDTEDAELIEGNAWGDTFWGVCNGVGKNMLGKILMNRREQLMMEKFFE